VSPEYTTYEIARNIVDSLVAETPSGKFVPWLATSWTVSPNAEQYTFNLRQGVTFSDGTSFNAAAVKANFDRIVNPATKSEFSASLLADYTSTTAVSPYVAQVNFSAPDASFLAALSTTYLGIESPSSWAKLAPCAPPIGSGPFVSVAYTAQENDTLQRSPVPYKWAPSTDQNQTGSAYLDQIKFEMVTGDSVRTGGLTSGQFQYAEGIPPTEVASIKGQGYPVIDASQSGMVYSYQINTTIPPLNDIKVREAVTDAIDTAGIVKALYDDNFKLAHNTLSSTTPDLPIFNTPLPYNPAKAEAILNADGWSKKNSAGVREKDGQLLSITLLSADVRYQRQSVDLLAQQELQKVGFQVILDKPSLSAASSGNDPGLEGVAYILVSPYIMFDFFTPGGGYTDITKTNDPAITAKLEAANAQTNPAKATVLYGQAEKLVEAYYATVPVNELTRLDATSPKLHGVELDAAKFQYFESAWLAK
jgi:peptide/nickel transport system substrate-binding protein